MATRITNESLNCVPSCRQAAKRRNMPETWKTYRISDCLERVEHPVEVDPNAMYTQIGIRSHGKGLFYKEPVSGAELGNKVVYWIEPDCFILNIVFAWEQAIGKTTAAEAGMIGSHRFPMYRPVKNLVDIDYLIYYFLTKRGTDILEAASPGGAGRNRTLGQDRFLKSKIILPPIEEQRRIAEILATQDRVIELYGRKIEELQRFKKGALSKMFPEPGHNTPEVRFPGFTDAWKQRKVGDIAGRTYGGGTPKTSVDEYWGGDIPWIQSSNLEEHRLFDVDIQKHITESGLQKSATQLVPKGSIAVVSHVGVGKLVFIPFEYTTSQDFISLSELKTEPFFTCYALYRRIQGDQNAVQGSAIKGITKEDLLNKEISVPSLNEQTIIGVALQSLDNLITLHQRKRDEEIRKKKALMQLLLTGKVRVK